MEQEARQIVLNGFRKKKIQFLVVTDVASRGIDIPLLENVINFDFPAKGKIFIHRCGRTARAGAIGHAWSILNRNELPYLVDLKLFLGKDLKNNEMLD